MYGKRGAAVSIHSVPKHIVEQYSLTDEWKWKSTLVGTARPFQFLYDEQASTKSADWGRTGSSYDLYLSDYKSSNVSNAVSADNIIKLNSNFGESSKLEMSVICELNRIMDEKQSYYKFSQNGQKIVPIDGKKFYKLDFYNKEHNLVIEVMGDYWHCNPSIYSYDYYNKNKNMTASEIWKEDLKRKSLECIL